VQREGGPPGFRKRRPGPSKEPSGFRPGPGPAMGDGADGAAASAPPAAGPGFSYFAVFHNYPLVAALVGFAVAQSIKFFVTW
jgi:hypothetical protein